MNMALFQHPVGSGLHHSTAQDFPPRPRGVKRKAAPIEFHEQPPGQQPHNPWPVQAQAQGQVAASVWCDLCSLNCVTHHNLKVHIRGKRHKAKCDILSLKSGNPEKPDEPPLRPVVPSPLAWCGLCKVNCLNPHNLRRHLQGKKHRAKCEKEQPSSQAEHGSRSGAYSCSVEQKQVQVQGSPVWCTLCRLNCMNLRNLKRHLQGKKHRAKFDEEPLQAYGPSVGLEV